MNSSRIRPMLAPLVLFGVLLLGGCGSTSNSAGTTEQKITTALLFGGQTTLPEPPKVAAREVTCPATAILEGTAAYRVGDQAARGVSYQAAINDLARDCALEGQRFRVKVGVQGRVILGDAGKAGTYSIPVRVAVRRGNDTVYTKLIPVSVTIAANEAQSPVVVVDDAISLPVSAEDPGLEYKVFVGIDPQGQRGAGKKRR